MHYGDVLQCSSNILLLSQSYHQAKIFSKQDTNYTKTPAEIHFLYYKTVSDYILVT